jgi:hypothetical protein
MFASWATAGSRLVAAVEHLRAHHAGAILACDFFVTITATFRTLYVFVVLDVGTRWIVHWNVTEHPTVRMDRATVPCDCAW